ncbi:HNH endonuclease signature motif containing protein [soil metagenome]
MVDDATVVGGGITGWLRAAAACEARGLAAIAELARRRCAEEDDDDRYYWPADPWDSAGAEVAAAMNVGLGKARTYMETALLLRDRLPRTNALFKDGAITAYMATIIYDRTYNVTDEATWALLDAALSDSHTTWGPLPQAKLVDAIDFWINAFDPAAVRRTRSRVRDRSITFGDREDSDGLVSFWGRLLGTDAALLKKRLTVMADGVCKDDPRTRAQRLADALGALAAKSDFLACRCDNPECTATGDDGRASSFLMHLLAPAEALEGQPDPLIHGDDTPPAKPEPYVAESRQPAPSALDDAPLEPEPAVAQADPEPAAPRQPTGVIIGGGVVPTPLLVELLRHGAKVSPGQPPCAQAEPRYRPSTALRESVQTRDMTCRAPGCNRPAEFCDVDHSVPYPKGPTHACNTKCYCRKHHLIKTFWSGEGGWSDQQLPDGTLLTTSPAGITYTTKPGVALFFPYRNTPTPPPTTVPNGVKPPGNDLDTFKRKRTRTQDRDRRIQAERARNAARLAEDAPGF